MPTTCMVCHTQPGAVCPECQNTITRQLRDLPKRLAALAAALMPGQAPAAERVSVSSHVTANLPVNTAALSLLAPGTSEITVRLHPLVRHWSAKRKVLVTTHVGGYARTVPVEVTDWFHETVIGADGRPVLVHADDDQVGVVPPREWLDAQVRRWRSHFHHHVPPRTRRHRDVRTDLPGAYRTLLRTPGGPRLLGALAALRTVGGAHARMAHLGLLGYEDPAARAADPVLDAIERRCGPAATPHTVQWDIDYLLTWLPEACAEDALELAEFAAQLTALHAEISRALGDVDDKERIGRCPAFLADPDAPDGRARPCGAELWQDNAAFTAQVQCPRCHSTWDTRGHAGAGTAREIRRVWPVDRRRRYNADEIDRIPALKCRGCTGRVRLEWREVTGSRDKQRTWQPIKAWCDTGCDEARRVL